MNETSNKDEPTIRPVIEAYKDFCGVKDGRFDDCTDDEMQAYAFRGYADFRAGWDAALGVLTAEIERQTWATDNGGRKYIRPAGVDKLIPLIRRMQAK